MLSVRLFFVLASFPFCFFICRGFPICSFFSPPILSDKRVACIGAALENTGYGEIYAYIRVTC